MSHCVECISGSIHAGTPTGVEEQVHGLNTYIVGNRTNPRAIIVIYSDVFGLALPNNKLIADAYAKSGEYLVYLPDFFGGDPAPMKMADLLIPVDAAKQGSLSKYTGLLVAMPAFLSWTRRHGDAPTKKTCTDFLAKLRAATPPAQKIGMVGFCWGGRFAIRAALESSMVAPSGTGSKKVPLVDAVVALHPSNLVLPEDAQDLVVPVSFGWGEVDSVSKIKNMTKIQGMYAGKKAPEMEHKVYKPGRHGFAVRGNPDDPAERKCLEDSNAQVLDWFAKWL